jgi:hypothetical protein
MVYQRGIQAQTILEDAVRITIEILTDSRDDDAAASQCLAETARISGASASTLITFVPIAFARVWLAGSPLRFPATYLRCIESPEPLKRESFDANPVFLTAYQQAQQLIRDGFSNDKLLAIASRGPEFRAVNTALLDGAQLENLELAELVVTYDDFNLASEG